MRRTPRVRALLVVAATLLLSGCGESPEELARRRARFVTTCQSSEFTNKQCLWLWAYSESVRERQDSSDAANAALAGAAVGLAAGGAASPR